VSAEVRHLAVVGAGLVGGSIAAAARDAGIARITLTDSSPEVRARARALGLADEVMDDLPSTVVGADLVIAAVPTGVVGDVLVAAAAIAPAQAILTDAASLKYELTLDIESRLRASGGGVGRFVGGHPMAGSERSGPEAADSRLFQGATWVLTPTAATADDVLPTLSSFLRSLGARVVALPPERHDELVAVVSHLPQVAASALADIAADVVEATGDAVLAVAGGGFRDTTRIAASDPRLWLGILQGNRAAVLEALTAYTGRLERIRAAIAGDDWATVEAVLSRASAARRRLVPKEQAEQVVDVVVPLDDRPGQLAAATTALGAAGVNVEDLAMRHATEGRRGALLVRVAAGTGAQAVRVLEASGLVAHLDDNGVREAAGRPPTGADGADGAVPATSEEPGEARP
jgi:prephenate dehydrogenase